MTPQPLPFSPCDGGREKAGFRGSAPGDCVCRSIAIATQMPYREVYDTLNQLAHKERPRSGNGRSHARNGVARQTYDRYLKSRGWKWVPCMSIGSGCKVHLRAGEIPNTGRLIVRLSKHLTAVVNGVIYDTYNPDRGGERCVYGYYYKPQPR